MATAKLRPTKNADGTSVVLPSRTGSHGEAATIPYGVGRTSMADEGSYYVIQNAIMGTQLTGHVAPAYSDAGVGTKSIIHFYNGGSKDISLDYLVVTTVVANASATLVGFSAWTDNKGATSRASGGTAITTVTNTRSDSTNTSGITMFAGPVVTAPATNVHRVLQRVVKPYIGVALDSYTFVFGNSAMLPAAFALVTAVTHTATGCPPVVVGPGGNFAFAQIGPSGASTAITFEFEMGFWER